MQRQKSSGASVLFSHKTLGGHPFSLHPPPLSAATLPHFSLGWPSPLLPWQPPTISFSSIDLPLPTQQGSRRGGARWIEEEERIKEMFYPPSIADFLGETLGKDGILVPPYNYVFLEVVDHVD
jgi:hypothetical protein